MKLKIKISWKCVPTVLYILGWNVAENRYIKIYRVWCLQITNKTVKS